MHMLHACLAIAIFQGIHGSPLLDIEFADLDFIDPSKPLEQEAYFTELHQNNELTELNQIQQLDQSSRNCTPLFDTWKRALNLVGEVTKWAQEAWTVVNDDLSKIGPCTKSGDFMCILNTVAKARDDVTKLGPELLEYKSKLEQLFNDLTHGLWLCIRLF